MIKTIRKQTENEIIINKSRFIAILIPISDVELVPLYLEEIKERYPDASHYCYAYRIDAAIKASDDGEPSKTAGMPMMNVLEKNGLNHILAVVVRYFGGIKLGAGGLVRAYSQSVVECLEICDIVYTKKAPYYRLSFDYSLIRQIDYIFKTKAIDIYIKDYQEQVHYECFILNEAFIEKLNERFFNQLSWECLKYDDVEIKGDENIE